MNMNRWTSTRMWNVKFSAYVRQLLNYWEAKMCINWSNFTWWIQQSNGWVKLSSSRGFKPQQQLPLSNCQTILKKLRPGVLWLPTKTVRFQGGTSSKKPVALPHVSPNNELSNVKPLHPRKFNSSPLKMGNPKRKLIFQPSFFRGYIKFRGCNPQHQNNDREAINPLVIPTASKLACGISLVGRRCSYHVVLWEWRLVLISPTPPENQGFKGIFSRIHQRWVRWRSSWKITRIGLRNSPSRK